MSLTVLDLSAAFDTVDHSILTSTLKNKFGIDELTLKWFNSYLQPRSFKVAVNGKYSDKKQLIYSVPRVPVQVPTCSTYIAAHLMILIHWTYI